MQLQREGNASHSRLKEEHINTGGGEKKRLQSLQATTEGYISRGGKSGFSLQKKLTKNKTKTMAAVQANRMAKWAESERDIWSRSSLRF